MVFPTPDMAFPLPWLLHGGGGSPSYWTEKKRVEGSPPAFSGKRGRADEAFRVKPTTGETPRSSSPFGDFRGGHACLGTRPGRHFRAATWGVTAAAVAAWRSGRPGPQVVPGPGSLPRRLGPLDGPTHVNL